MITGDRISLFNKVVLIDDSNIDNIINKEVLKRNDLTDIIEEFTSARAALSKLLNETKEEYPDLILLDINMPDMDGFEFLQALINVEKLGSIPIVMLSSSDNIEDKMKSKIYPSVKGYIVKPLEADKLLSALDND